MTCARCGLSLRLRGAQLRLDRCPRCFAYAGVTVPLRNGSLSLLLGGAPESPRPPLVADHASFGHLIVCTEHSGGETVIALRGKLDIASERCLDQALRRAWATSVSDMVIDLSELEFIDATGMKVLLRAREYMLERGSQLTLLPGPPSVQRMFQLTGTLGLFTFRG
jgi:anti-anti-sigma factor